jgi:hypothetical protein
VLAPGGDDRDADAMLAALDASQAALAAGVPTNPRRRYVGGFCNGVFSAYHAVARDRRGYAGFFGIAGFLRGDDARAVGRRLHGEGAYLVISANDEVIGTASIARAWHDMLAGVTSTDDDGLGSVGERLSG